MTAEERGQIAALTREVAELRGTLTNEVKHITDRLDSHSGDIKTLAGEMGEVKLYMAASKAVNGYRREHSKEEKADQARVEEHQATACLQARGKFYDLLLILAGAVVGLGVSWVQGFFSCNPAP